MWYINTHLILIRILLVGKSILYQNRNNNRKNVRIMRVKGMHLGLGRTIKKIAVGTNHVIVLLTTGKLHLFV